MSVTPMRPAAGWYCRSLEARFSNGFADGGMLRELRTSTVCPSPASSVIHAAAYA